MKWVFRTPTLSKNSWGKNRMTRRLVFPASWEGNIHAARRKKRRRCHTKGTEKTPIRKRENTARGMRVTERHRLRGSHALGVGL